MRLYDPSHVHKVSITACQGPNLVGLAKDTLLDTSLRSLPWKIIRLPPRSTLNSLSRLSIHTIPKYQIGTVDSQGRGIPCLASGRLTETTESSVSPYRPSKCFELPFTGPAWKSSQTQDSATESQIPPIAGRTCPESRVQPP